MDRAVYKKIKSAFTRSFYYRWVLFVNVFIFNSYVASVMALPQTVLCVDSQAVASQPNGACWENPYLDLEQALERARQDPTIREIWIADGIYKPSKTYAPKDTTGKEVIAGAISLPQNNPGITVNKELKNYKDHLHSYNQFLRTFNLIDKVDIYGGFQGQSHPAGGEKSHVERSPNTNEYQTILDGDIDGLPFTPDNVWHVLFAGNDITLEGVKVKLDRLVVRNGNALNAPYYPINFPLLSKQVPKHYHDDGAGLAVFTKSQIELSDMVFENNIAVSGGAIFAQDGSMLKITRSFFKNNHAYNGGAITVSGGGPHDLIDLKGRVTTLNIMNSVFQNNSAYWGMAIFTRDNQYSPPKKFSGAKVIINQSSFTQNQLNIGRGTVVLMYSSGQISHSLFADNEGLFSSEIECILSSFALNNNEIRNTLPFYSQPLSYQCKKK